MTMKYPRLVTAGLVLAMLVALVLGVGGLAFAALVGGPVGVWAFVIYVGCMLFGLTDAYTSRRRKHSFRGTPALRA